MKKRKPKPLIYVDELADVRMTLKEWEAAIQKLIKIHGKTAIMETDAGHNNVSFVINPPKR